MIHYYNVLATNGNRYSVASMNENFCAGDKFYVPEKHLGMFCKNDVGEKTAMSVERTHLPTFSAGYDIFTQAPSTPSTSADSQPCPPNPQT